MIPKEVEARGRTVAEATEAALQQLQLPAEQARVEVVDPGSKGFLGLGSRDAVVRVVPVLEPAQVAHQVVASICAAAGYTVGIEAREDQGIAYVDIAGDSLGELIGRRGRTLDALQYLVQLACGRVHGGPRQVVLDIGDYRKRRQAQLERMARQCADSVRRTGRKVVMESMTAAERRLVHLALQQVPDIETRSEGDEPYRRIVVSHKPKDSSGSPKRR